MSFARTCGHALHEVLVWFGFRDNIHEWTQPVRQPQQASRTRFSLRIIGLGVASLLVGGLIGGVIAHLVRSDQSTNDTAQLLLDARDLKKFSVDFRGGHVVVLRSLSTNALMVIIDKMEEPPARSSIGVGLLCRNKTVDLGTLSTRYFSEEKLWFSVKGTNSCTRLHVFRVTNNGLVKEDAVINFPDYALGDYAMLPNRYPFRLAMSPVAAQTRRQVPQPHSHGV